MFTVILLTHKFSLPEHVLENFKSDYIISFISVYFLKFEF